MGGAVGENFGGNLDFDGFSRFRSINTLMETSDRQEAQDYLGKLLAPHKLQVFGNGTGLKLTHAAARLYQSTLHFVSYGTCEEGVLIDAPCMGDDLLLEFPLCGKAQVEHSAWGAVVEPGGLIVAPRGQRYVSRMTSNYAQLALQIPAQALAHAAAIDIAELRQKPLTFEFGCSRSGATARLLMSLIQSACIELNADEEPFRSARVRRSFEQAILALVLDLPHTYSDRLEDEQAAVLPSYMRRAEDFIKSSLSEEVDLEDIVRVSGVSRRTLHAGFRRYRHSTPLSFLKCLRLEAAKCELERAHRSRKSVTEVATEFGFFHLSKFSRDFKARFGRLPSDILRQ